VSPRDGRKSPTRRAVLAAATLAATPGRGWAAGASGRHALPFRLADNQLTVPVHFGAKGPFRFLIDSGAIHIGMSGPQLAGLGLPVTGADTIAGVAGNLDTRVYRAAKLRVGDSLTFPDIEVRGLDIGEVTGPDSAVGILPLHVFGRSSMDFINRSLTVEDSTARPPRDMLLFPASGPVGADPRPYAIATLQEATIRVMLDTGYSGSLILTSKYVRERNLADRYGQGRLETLAGATGSVVASMMQVEALGFAGHTFKDHWIELSDPALNIPATPGYDGVIGVELLRRFDLWTDGRTGAVGLRPNALIDDGERYDRSGLDLTAAPMGEVGLIVTHVSPDSPADKAGLRVFDRVLGFKNDAGLNDLRWTLSGPPGTVVALRISRTSGEMIVKLVLADSG
jgi:hypothetical protein